MLLLVGVVLLALGLLSGVALVLGSFAVLGAQPGLTLWFTFPLLCLAGFGLVATHARVEVVKAVSLASSAVLLLLALASIASLVLGATAWVRAPADSAALWFVLVVGAAMGSLGAASFGRRAGEA